MAHVDGAPVAGVSCTCRVRFFLSVAGLAFGSALWRLDCVCHCATPGRVFIHSARSIENTSLS